MPRGLLEFINKGGGVQNVLSVSWFEVFPTKISKKKVEVLSFCYK